MTRMDKAAWFGAIVAIITVLSLASCKEHGMEPRDHTEVIAADTSFVDSLKITARPITDSNAIAIAELASAAKAISATQVTYENIAAFKVVVKTGSITLNLFIRISDGALIKDDDDDGR